MARGIVVFLAMLLGLGTRPGSAQAFAFIAPSPPPLTTEIAHASMVLVGTLGNAKRDPDDWFKGSTEFHIEVILKKHDILGDKKMIVLPRYLPVEENRTRMVIFFDNNKGKIDPYRGIPVHEGSDLVEYIKGALAVKDKPIGDRLRYFFTHLDNPDVEVNNDAYKEFERTPYKDCRDMFGILSSDKVARLLRDPNTPGYRVGLYAIMLGHCGTGKDAKLLRTMLGDPQTRLSSGMEGILTGYTILRPKDGWSYTRKLLTPSPAPKNKGKRNKSKKEPLDFVTRYSALKSARFFFDYRPDIIDKKRVVEAISLLLDQGDIADIAIEDLRKWQRVEKTDQILALYGKESHDSPIVRRSIIRFALGFPDNPKAAAFIAMLREKDRDMIEDLEEYLKLETTAQRK